MQEERLNKIRDEQIQEKLDRLPSALRHTITNYIPDAEFIISYEKSKPDKNTEEKD